MRKQQTQSSILTSQDVQRLRQLLEGAAGGSRDQDYVESLEEELENAEVVNPATIPADVVTMNSRVRLQDLGSPDALTYTLVMPHQADIDRGKTSVIAPLGIAILGQRVGRVVKFRVPGGFRELKILQVLYQPEAAGDYHL